MYSTYYSEKYSHHVEHLILVSPAGVNTSGVKDADLHWILRLGSRFHLTPMVRSCVASFISHNR